MESSCNKNKQRHSVLLLHYESLTRGMFSSKNLPIMPALCSKLAYYAGIMLDALACLLCLKLCRHNRRMPNCDLSIRSNGYKLYKNYYHLNIRKYTFPQRIINDWNNLPGDIIESPLLNLNLMYTGKNYVLDL